MFASQEAYRDVNEQFVGRLFENLPPRDRHLILDIAAATGLMSRLAHSRARAMQVGIDSVLLDVDLPTLPRGIFAGAGAPELTRWPEDLDRAGDGAEFQLLLDEALGTE